MPKARVWAFLGSVEAIVVRSGASPIIHRWLEFTRKEVVLETDGRRFQVWRKSRE